MGQDAERERVRVNGSQVERAREKSSQAESLHLQLTRGFELCEMENHHVCRIQMKGGKGSREKGAQ